MHTVRFSVCFISVLARPIFITLRTFPTQAELHTSRWSLQMSWSQKARSHGPRARYVILRVAHASGMPGTFSPPPRGSDPNMHHGTCVTHVPRCMPGSLTSGFLSSRWRGKRPRHSLRMRNPQFCVSSKRPISSFAYLIRGPSATSLGLHTIVINIPYVTQQAKEPLNKHYQREVGGR